MTNMGGWPPEVVFVPAGLSHTVGARAPATASRRPDRNRHRGAGNAPPVWLGPLGQPTTPVGDSGPVGDVAAILADQDALRRFQ
jgi:hypothetical protein